jgi:hypothetical protein
MKSNFNKLILAWTLSTSIRLGIQWLNICFDNVQRIRLRSSVFSTFSNDNEINQYPIRHSSNTIRVYNFGTAKNMELTLVTNDIKHINFVAFHTIEKRAYLILICAKCCIKKCCTTMPKFLHNFQLPWSLNF